MKNRIPTFDEFVNESADVSSDTFTNDILKLMNDYSYKASERRAGYITASKHDRNGDESFDFIEDHNHPAGKYYVFMQSKMITSSVSLADPKKNYQTTSARRVTTKSIKTVEYTDDFNKYISIVKKHLEKVEKLK